MQDKLNDDAPTNADFELLVEYLKRSRGFDFTGYKRSSLIRRVDRRMQMLGVGEYAGYMDYLQVHPDEFGHLFNTILINVTAFFRDLPSWEFLETEVLPKILAAKGPNGPIRIWSAGCASGEEAYTLAMVMASALGTEQVRERVKIYATDVDEEALTQARQANYGERAVAGVPAPLLERHFEHINDRYVFHKDLRRAVIFGRHDLIQDAPISRIDMLVCRNTLMYFNAEIQTKILGRLHFALNDTGCLFLGKAEMLFTHTNLFVPLDLKRRIFSRAPAGSLREAYLSSAQSDGNSQANRLTNTPQIREIVFSEGPTAQIVIDSSGRLALANERARALFRLSHRDMGRLLQDLEISYRPVELRSSIEQAYSDRRTVIHKDVVWPPNLTERFYMDVQVTPLLESGGGVLGASVTFVDVSRYKQLHEELQKSNLELESAHEEIQSTNEELETTNEELQSTVEELETTNEELQSTNEELETMNEELQSTNEELQTINDELRQRSDALNDVNAFISSILANLQDGVVVLNQDLQVQIWNHRSEDLWGLRSEEVQGKHFLSLDIGLPVNELKAPIGLCLTGENERGSLTVRARNRRGKEILCRTVCGPLFGPQREVSGIIIVMKEEDASAPNFAAGRS